MEERKRVCDGTESEGRSVSYCIYLFIDLFYTVILQGELFDSSPWLFYLFRKIKMLRMITAICDKDTVPGSASGSTSDSATVSVILIPDTS